MSAFLRTYRTLQGYAHEKPAIFFSCVLGISGPILAYTYPGIRMKYFGYKYPDPPPTTFPLPQRARVPVTGYDD